MSSIENKVVQHHLYKYLPKHLYTKKVSFKKMIKILLLCPQRNLGFVGYVVTNISHTLYKYSKYPPSLPVPVAKRRKGEYSSL
jgi:hypothetical protein